MKNTGQTVFGRLYHFIPHGLNMLCGVNVSGNWISKKAEYFSLKSVVREIRKKKECIFILTI